MVEFVEYVVKHIVRNPDAVQIRKVDRRGEVLLELRVHPEDVGTVVGKDGGTINALRTLLMAAGGKKGVKYSLKLLEGE